MSLPGSTPSSKIEERNKTINLGSLENFKGTIDIDENGVMKLNGNPEIKKVYFFYRESFLQSALADSFFFALIIGGFWFNHSYLGNKWYLDVFFLFLAVVFAMAHNNANHERFTDLRKFKERVRNLKNQ